MNYSILLLNSKFTKMNFYFPIKDDQTDNRRERLKLKNGDLYFILNSFKRFNAMFFK